MKVFIFGSTGGIGLPVAQAFARNGHIVYGQTRMESNVKKLEADEITAVVADPSKVEEWKSYVAKSDVVIDCLSGLPQHQLSAMLFEKSCEIAANVRESAPPKMTYILCSGLWVYGEDHVELKSERQPGNTPIPLVEWRVPFERKIVTSQEVNGIVIRPGFVYGKGGSVLSAIFRAAQPGKVMTWPGSKDGRYNMIHADDLADLFVKVGEAGPICKGLFFDGVNGFTESVDDILEAVVKVSGASGYSYRAPENRFEEAMTTVSRLRPSLARTLVGWRPLKPSFVDGLHQYYASWKASL